MQHGSLFLVGEDRLEKYLVMGRQSAKKKRKLGKQLGEVSSNALKISEIFKKWQVCAVKSGRERK